MIPEITQKNVHMFIPYKVSKICAEICKDENISAKNAVQKFYKTKLSRRLGQEDSKLWHCGWVTLYEMYLEEQNEL